MRLYYALLHMERYVYTHLYVYRCMNIYVYVVLMIPPGDRSFPDWLLSNFEDTFPRIQDIGSTSFTDNINK